MIPAFSDGVPGQVPAISAHRGGSENGSGGTYQAYLKAVTTGADYVEFDVRRTLDGTLVAWHDGRVGRVGRGRSVTAMSYSRLCEMAGREVPRIAEVMRLLAGRAAAHIDLKDAGCADAVVRLGLDLLGPAGMIVTTDDRVALAWVKRTFPDVPVGLTIGGGLARAARLSAPLLREPSWSRAALDGAVRADWVAIRQRLARADEWAASAAYRLRPRLVCPYPGVTGAPARLRPVTGPAVRRPSGPG